MSCRMVLDVAEPTGTVMSIRTIGFGCRQELEHAGSSQTGDRHAEAAIMAFPAFTDSLLLAMFTRTEPHPALGVDPVSLGSLLAASLAIGAAADVLASRGGSNAMAMAMQHEQPAAVSEGPQLHFDTADRASGPP